MRETRDFVHPLRIEEILSNNVPLRGSAPLAPASCWVDLSGFLPIDATQSVDAARMLETALHSDVPVSSAWCIFHSDVDVLRRCCALHDYSDALLRHFFYRHVYVDGR